jgi:hypothetical protein
MTSLTTRYRLKQALTPQDFQKLGCLTTVYGICRLKIDAQHLVIEYDASRIHEAEILAQLRKAGIVVEPPMPIPLGGFDYTGEFKDLAWPTQGLTPVNQKPK